MGVDAGVRAEDVPALEGLLAVWGKTAGVLSGAEVLVAVPPPPQAVRAKALMSRTQTARSRCKGWDVVGMKQLLGASGRAQAVAQLQM